MKLEILVQPSYLSKFLVPGTGRLQALLQCFLAEYVMDRDRRCSLPTTPEALFQGHIGNVLEQRTNVVSGFFCIVFLGLWQLAFTGWNEWNLIHHAMRLKKGSELSKCLQSPSQQFHYSFSLFSPFQKIVPLRVTRKTRSLFSLFPKCMYCYFCQGCFSSK